MYVLLEKGDELLPGDKFLSGYGGYTGRVRSGEMYLRKLTGWEAVKHAIKAEVLGNDKEGCETTMHFWNCECEHDYINRFTDFEEECPCCGASAGEASDSRKAEVILEIIEEKSEA